MRESALPQSAAAMFFDGDDVDRDMSGARVVLQAIQNGPAVTIGELDIQSDRHGTVFVRQCQRHIPGSGNQSLESFGAGQVQKNPGELQVVFNDQDSPIALFDIIAIVENRRSLARQLGQFLAVESLSRRPGRFDRFEVAP